MIRKTLSCGKQLGQFFREILYDRVRYLRAAAWSGAPKIHDLVHLEGDIIRKYHVLEKALTMPDFRPRAGKETFVDLIQDLVRWSEISPEKDAPGVQVLAAHGAVTAYLRRHQELGIEVKDLLGTFVPLDVPDTQAGGWKEYHQFEAADLESLGRSLTLRASLRNFDQSRVPENDFFREAAKIAIKAPSVCNRQTGRMHLFKGEMIKKLLSFQTGNRGFGHTIPALLVVTTDMRLFLSHSERNQPYVDGGLFGMQLMLALQSLGIGNVPLNWCVSSSVDRQFRKISGIPDHEVILMLVGCGYSVAGAFVPRSRRHSSDKILTIH